MRSLVTASVFVVAAVMLGWAVVDTQTDPVMVTVMGEVSAPCSVLNLRPTPRVSDVDGAALTGSPWISTSTGSGECTAAFTVMSVPEREQYRITIGPASAVVDRASIGSVSLAV